MPINAKQAMKMAQNIAKAGGKWSGGAKVAAKALVPIAASQMTWSMLRKTPVVKDLLSGLEKVDDYVTQRVLGKIPVIGWITKQFSNFQAVVGRGESAKYNLKGEYIGKKNDPKLYTEKGGVTLPINPTRPMGFGFNSDVNPEHNTGFNDIPKLLRVLLEAPEYKDSYVFDETVTDLFQKLRESLRSNLPYDYGKLKRYLYNSNSLYAYAKILEKKLGWLKYVDPQFPDFQRLWRYNVPHGAEDNSIGSLEEDPRFNPLNVEYAVTLNTYELLQHQTFALLPKNYKAWVDHYLGSVFIGDLDAVNAKYLYFDMERINWMNEDGTLTTIDVTDAQDLLDRLTAFNREFSIVRADLAKANIAQVNYFMKDISTYKPVPVVDATIVQAIINSYTSDSILKYNNDSKSVRLDFLDKSDDPYTALILNGAISNKLEGSDINHVKTWSVKNMAILCYASNINPIELAYNELKFVDSEGNIHNEYSRFTVPFYLQWNSDIQETVTNTKTSGDRLTFPSAGSVTSNNIAVTLGDYTINIPAINSQMVVRNAQSIYDYLVYPLFRVKTANTPIFKWVVLAALCDTNSSGVHTTTIQLASMECGETESFDTAVLRHMGATDYPTEEIRNYISISSGWYLISNCNGASAEDFISIEDDDPDDGVLGPDGENVLVSFSFDGYESEDEYGNTIDHVQTFIRAESATNASLYGYVTVNEEARALNAGWPQMAIEFSAISGSISIALTGVTTGGSDVISLVKCGLAEFVFTKAGFSIPIISTKAVLNAKGTFVVSANLLKEDFIPFYINIGDIPTILYYMYRSLLSY